jgi:hypothetical protein
VKRKGCSGERNSKERKVKMKIVKAKEKRREWKIKRSNVPHGLAKMACYSP